MELSVLIAGDFCPRERIIPLLGQNCILSHSIAKEIKNNDISIVNLECPVSENKKNAMIKEGPNLSCDHYAIKELSYMGFNVVTLANNHILDYGSSGITDTLKACKEFNIRTVGAGINSDEAATTLYESVHDVTVAIINCCEHEFSVTYGDTAGSNPLDPIQQYYKIQEARQKADYIIVIVHGGLETYQLPTNRMKEIYRFFIDAGADVVVNHHQHCYSGYEHYKEKLIFYGLGNFCFDWRGYSDDAWHEGFLVKLVFDYKAISFKIIPYIQCKEEPVVKMMSLSERELFNDRLTQLNSIIQDPKRLEDCFEAFARKNKVNYSSILEPYNSRLLRGMFRRHLLPSTLSNRRLLKILDYIGCESHREILLNYLLSRYKELTDGKDSNSN